jgi:hypothetical protein
MSQAEKSAGLGFGYLPDENPATADPKEASRWVRVYSDLIRFKEQILAAAHSGLDLITEAVAREAAIAADLPLLEGENDRLHERLNFWKRRHLELRNEAVPGDQPA